MTEVIFLQGLLVFELLPLYLARWVPVGPSDTLPRPTISGKGCSLLTSELQTLGGLARGDGCVALCFITIYCSCYFNIYGTHLSCELISRASLWSAALQGAGPGVTLICFWSLPYLLY